MIIRAGRADLALRLVQYFTRPIEFAILDHQLNITGNLVVLQRVPVTLFMAISNTLAHCPLMAVSGR
jgi:hypothetical protein